MQHFGSFALIPGKTGEHFYNKFFQFYGLDSVYKPKKVEDLKHSLSLAIQENYSGISITMPYKSQVLDYLYSMSPDCKTYNSCNTILIDEKKLYGFNTDFDGVVQISKNFMGASKVNILGNGSMGSMFHKYLVSTGFEVAVFSPSLGNWSERHQEADIFINCTSLGTSSNASPLEHISSKALIVDLSLKKTELFNMSTASKAKYISGLDFYKCVFLAQFKIYTGIAADSDYFDSLAKIL